MNDTIQKLIEDAAEYQKPDFSFADLITSFLLHQLLTQFQAVYHYNCHSFS